MPGIRIGSLSGIPIEIDWTLILFSLLVLLLPAITLVLLITLYICVLMHELAHSANALRNNVRVKKIVLNLFGGGSVIDEINLDPRVEFNITLVGPMTSILLGCAFGILAIFTGPGALNYVFNWLFIWNIILGIINLIPVFPLDGGRIMRSYLQRKTDFYGATMVTAKVSKYMIGAIIVISSAYILLNNQSIIYNEVLAVIILITLFYVYGGLRAEVNNATVRKQTRGVRIGSLVSKNFTFVSPDASISQLYKAVMKGNGRIFLMKQKGEIYLLNLSSMPRREIKYAKDLAYKLPMIDSKANVTDALIKMESEEIGLVAISSNKKFAGIVTSPQIQSFLSLHMMRGK